MNDFFKSYIIKSNAEDSFKHLFLGWISQVENRISTLETLVESQRQLIAHLQTKSEILFQKEATSFDATLYMEAVRKTWNEIKRS